MALKSLMLKKRIDDKKTEREKVRATAAELETREAEIAQAIEEATTQEEQEAVEAAIGEFEADKEAAEAEAKRLDGEIEDLEAELAEIETKQEPAAEPAPTNEERKEQKTMITRAFKGMTAAETEAVLAREEVKDFLQRVRELKNQGRAISGGELLTPGIFLGVIKENILEYSKLYKHVNVVIVNGKAREVVQGTIPEAIWMEVCSPLSELDLVFNDVEVDAYQVGGYIPVCNATLEDSDFNLANAIITALGAAIGLALDKAILFGDGTRMPLGVVSRIELASAPSSYPATARPWTDLSSSNKVTVSGEGVALFQSILAAFGAAKSKYSRGAKVWTMNEKTYANLVSNAMGINAAGAIVAGIDGNMPVIGGKIEVLDFIPDDIIVAGYFDLYLLAERQGTTIEQSEHVLFTQNKTVFRGVARYDGQPAIGEGFVVIKTAEAADTSVTFPEAE